MRGQLQDDCKFQTSYISPKYLNLHTKLNISVMCFSKMNLLAFNSGLNNLGCWMYVIVPTFVALKKIDIVLHDALVALTIKC